MKAPKKLQWLAHFKTGGGQHVLAADREEAIRKGERAARQHGTELVDVTGPDDPES